MDCLSLLQSEPVLVHSPLARFGGSWRVPVDVLVNADRWLTDVVLRTSDSGAQDQFAYKGLLQRAVSLDDSVAFFVSYGVLAAAYLAQRDGVAESFNRDVKSVFTESGLLRLVLGIEAFVSLTHEPELLAQYMDAPSPPFRWSFLWGAGMRQTWLRDPALLVPLIRAAMEQASQLPSGQRLKQRDLVAIRERLESPSPAVAPALVSPPQVAPTPVPAPVEPAVVAPSSPEPPRRSARVAALPRQPQYADVDMEVDPHSGELSPVSAPHRPVANPPPLIPAEAPVGSKCGICGLPQQEPVRMVECPCVDPFCRACMETWHKTADTCPTCRKRDPEAKDAQYEDQLIADDADCDEPEEMMEVSSSDESSASDYEAEVKEAPRPAPRPPRAPRQPRVIVRPVVPPSAPAAPRPPLASAPSSDFSLVSAQLDAGRLTSIAHDIWARAGTKTVPEWTGELRMWKDCLTVAAWETLAAALTQRSMQAVQALLNRNLRDELALQRDLADALLDVQMGDLVHLDLLCGTGAFSLAFEGACSEQGVRGQTVLCLDKAANAVSTCQLNFPRARVVRATLDGSFDCSALPYATLVSAGVPCPDFSRNRCNGRPENAPPEVPKLKGATPRSIDVFDALVRLAAGDNRPRVFLVENVANLVDDAENRQFLDSQLRRFEEHNYRHTWVKLNARDFGLPQNRDRVWVVLMKDSLAGWEAPQPHARGRPWFPDLLEPLEALAGHSCWVDLDEEGKPERKPEGPEQQLPVREHGVMFGHDPRHLLMDNDWVNLCSTPGLAPCLKQSMSNARSNRPVVLDGEQGEERWRYLTARECGNLLGFPASYHVDDRVGHLETRHTIENRAVGLFGNAVSPVVAQAVVSAVLRAIAHQDSHLPDISALGLEEEEEQELSA